MRADRFAAAGALLFSIVATAAGVTVNVVPPHLQLGTDPGAQIVIAGPPDFSAVEVSANHGTIASVKQVSPGHFVAEYRAPGHTFPRVAIVAVVGTSKGARVHGWTTLPLWGSAEAVLQTAPNANVSVRIGERTYGPIRADANGIGKVLVVVPPGVQSGFYGAKVLDLGLPRVALTHLVLEQAAMQADREQTVAARFYSVSEDGKPRSGLSLRGRVTLGKITQFKPEAPGVYAAQWTIPASAPTEAELSAWTPADPNSATTARLRLSGGPPVRIVLAATPDRVIAGAGVDVRLDAKVVDARGYPTAGAITFTPTLGAVGRAERESEGSWTAGLSVPRGFGGASSLIVRAEVAGAAPAEVTIALQVGPAQQLVVDPDRLSLVGNGANTVELRAQLLDVDRNPVEGTFEASVPVGELTPIPEPSGVRYQYRAPRSLKDDAIELMLSSNGLTARVPIALQAAPSWVTFAPKVGFLSNLGNANAFAAALELGFWLGEHFGLGLEAGYLFVPRDSEVTSGPLAGSRVLIRAHGVPMLGTVSWRGKLASTLPFQATAAGGVTVISSTLKLQDHQDVREVSVVPSAQLTASVGYALGTWTPFVEAGVRWMGDAQGNNLTGSLFSVGVSAGCRFDLL
jgi:hypothetical protein